MINAAQIKRIKSLSRKKFRKELGLFVVEGDKMVKELLEHQHRQTEAVYALDSWLAENPPPAGIQVYSVSAKELQRISTLQTPNQALALVKQDAHLPQWKALAGTFSILLDNIQDPGNLGTIIRTADWFGIEQIFCCGNTADVYNPKVIQSTMGSYARVNCIYMPAEEVFGQLPQDYPVMAALLEGENMHQTQLPNQGMLIIGNESKGIDSFLMPFITHKLHIPMSRPQGKSQFPESLNASVANAIMLSHLLK